MINDHRVTNWYFVHWFAKMGAIFGLVAVDSYSFNLYPKYKYLFILTAIVLFAQTWTTFRFNFRKKSIKWILISLISVISLSFILSRINLLNHDEINERILQNNTLYKYDIHLPTSKKLLKSEYYYLTLKIFLSENNEYEYPELTIGRSKEKIRHENLYQAITEYKEKHFFGKRRDRISYVLYIDKNTKMKSVIEVKNELLNLAPGFISYSVKPEEINNDIPFYVDEKYVLPSFSNLKSNIDYDNHVRIELTDINKIKINGISTTIENLENKIKETQSNGTKYLINIKVDETIAFETYIKTINEIIAAIDNMKSEFANDYPRLIRISKYKRSKKIRDRLRLINEKIKLKIIEEYH